MMAMSGADSPFCTLPLDFSLAVYLLYFCPLVHALSLSLSLYATTRTLLLLRNVSVRCQCSADLAGE